MVGLLFLWSTNVKLEKDDISVLDRVVFALLQVLAGSFDSHFISLNTHTISKLQRIPTRAGLRSASLRP